MSKQRPTRAKKGHKELRLSMTERLVVIGWALALFILMYLIIPKNAQRALEHAGAHAARQLSDTGVARRDSAKAHKH